MPDQAAAFLLMHEIGIIENIIREVERVALDNRLDKVTSINLKIGALRHIDPEYLDFAFDAVKRETIASEARLQVEYIPVIVKCNQCLNKFEVKGYYFICPDCDGVELEILSGKEVLLTSIRGEKRGEQESGN